MSSCKDAVALLTAPKEPSSKMVNIRMPHDLIERAKRMSKKHDVSFSHCVKTALNRFLDELATPPPIPSPACKPSSFKLKQMSFDEAQVKSHWK